MGIIDSYNGWAVYLSTGFGLNEKIHEGRHERCSVAAKQISPVQSPQLFNSIPMEENEIDIESHAARPESINTEKPVKRVNHANCYPLEQLTSVLQMPGIGIVQTAPQP